MSRYIIAVLVSLSFASATQAFDLKSELKVCAATKDSLSRLVCYDKLAQDIRLAAGDEEITVKSNEKTASYAATATAAAGHSVSKEDDFGKEHLDYASHEKENASIFSVIDTIKELHYGKLALTLSNGQVWHQTDTTKLLLHVGDKVELVEGMLSAIYLRKDGFNKRIRVKRIK